MTDMVLRGLPDALFDAIRRQAEAQSILRDAMSKESNAVRGVAAVKMPSPHATGRGLGSELAAIGREFGTTTVFDGLRDRAPLDAAKFE